MPCAAVNQNLIISFHIFFEINSISGFAKLSQPVVELPNVWTTAPRCVCGQSERDLSGDYWIFLITTDTVLI